MDDVEMDVVRHEVLGRAVIAVGQVFSSRRPVDGVLAGLGAVVLVQQVPVRFGFAATGTGGGLLGEPVAFLLCVVLAEQVGLDEAHRPPPRRQRTCHRRQYGQRRI
ncbi:hypothetical protein GCM10027447_12700 [Glycomyces halotolerans]